MIRSPLGVRLNPDPARSPREQIQQAAPLGARGVVLDAMGELGPDRLGETGRRDLRRILRTSELSLIAMSLPTRRPFDTVEQLEDRLSRADRAFAMMYELGCKLALVRVGAVPGEADPARHEIFRGAVGELAKRADHRGVRLAIEMGSESGEVLRAFLDQLDAPMLGASVDPGALLRMGLDPVAATIELNTKLMHAYATDATGAGAPRLAVSSPRLGFPPGVLDWESYLGSLEEIDYRGFLTIWPDPGSDPASGFKAMKARLDRF
jgi:sugar phosphate isomerase/epimerase